MSTSTIEVQLVMMENDKENYIRILKMPSGTIPIKGSQLHTKFSNCGIFKNSEYLVENVIHEYTDTDHADNYGSWGETQTIIKLVVKLISYETNEPTPVKKVHKTKKNSEAT